MCTAVIYQTKDHYFGRTLDYEISYGEKVVVTPRNYPFHFREVQNLETHFALIGMAAVIDGYPLYFEATNEKGLSMAGLNFPGNADYKPVENGKENVAPFEFIPWVLGQCETIFQVKDMLKNLNLADISFSESLPLSPLHWIIADKKCAITVEAVKDGIKVYDNPVGVLTNNPAFDFHMMNLNNYMHLSVEEPVKNFSNKLEMQAYSRGMGALGMPGDLSSASRFVRAAFTKMNSVSGDSEEESISQFFHILGAVTQQRGCVHMGDGKYEITLYTSCCNVDKGIYYYTTYENSQITAVDMNLENLEDAVVICYPLIKEQQILLQNGN